MKEKKCFSLAFAVWLAVVSAPAAVTVTTPYAGVTRHSAKSVSVNGRSVSYEVMAFNLLDPQLAFFLTPSNGALPYDTTRQTTKNFATAYGTEVAINTHFFDMNLSPQTTVNGFAASNGDVYSPFETGSYTWAVNLSSNNFAELVSGVVDGTNFTSSTSPPYTTFGCYGTFRRDGGPVSGGTDTFRARSQVGLSRDGTRLMLFACSSGMTERECADILATQFNAFHIMPLDGGGSTTLVLREGSSQNIIAIETSFLQRAVGANLGVQAGPYVAGIPDVMSWDADPITPGIQQGSGLWDYTATNWVSGGANRTWASPKTPVLGTGNGDVILLGARLGALNLSVAGGYTIGTNSGPELVLLGDLTTTGATGTTINAPLGASTSITKKGAQPLRVGTGSRISMLNLAEGMIDLCGQTFTLIDPVTPMTLSGGVITNGALVLSDTAPEIAVPTGITTLAVDLAAPKISKTGAGTLLCEGTVVLSTGLAVDDGILRLNSGVSLPTAPLSVTRGRLDLNGAGGTASSLTMGGGELVMGGGAVTLGGNVTFDAASQADGAVIDGRLILNAARTFTINDSTNAFDDLTVNAEISGAFTLTKAGAGALRLAASNSFSALTVNEGIVRNGTANALPDGTLTLKKGVVDLAGFDETVGAVTMGGTADARPEIQTGGGSLYLGNNVTYSATGHGLGALMAGRLNLPATRSFTVNDSSNAVTDMAIAADIAGPGGLTKKGAGTLELGGELGFGGAFIVDNGEVRLTGAAKAVNAVTLGGVASVTPLLDTGSTTLALNALTYSAAGNGLGALVKGRIDLGATNRTFTIGNSTATNIDVRMEARLTGSGGLTKSGAGTLELTGSNSLTGPIAVTAGGLRIAQAAALDLTPTVTFAANTTVDASGVPLNLPGLLLTGTGVVIGDLDWGAGRLLSSNGIFTVGGNLTQTGGTNEIVVGTNPGQMAVTGVATLGGALRVSMNGPPLAGTQTKVLLTASSIVGNFATTLLPAPPPGTKYQVAVTDTQVVLNVTPATALESWLTANGEPLDTSPGQDIEGDGWIVLSEYLLGGHPRLADGALLWPKVSDGRLQLMFTFNTGATDAIAEIQASSNLVDWVGILATTNGSAWSGLASFTQGGGTLAAMVVNDIVTNASPRFLRLRLAYP